MNSSFSRPLTITSRVRANDNVLFQELQEEAVLLNLNSGVYFGLNPVGTRIWHLIIEKQQVLEITRSIVAEFDVSEEQCTADLIALVTKLESQGLVTITA